MDELKETFIDINLDSMITLHENIKMDNMELGFMNTSQSHKFIHILVSNVYINDTCFDSSSDEDI